MEIITLLVLVLIVIVMVLAMLMCDHRVDDGYIVGKAHHPMRAIQDWDSLLHRHTLRYLPERFIIYVADCRGVNEITVTEADYAQYKEGQKWQRK